MASTATTPMISSQYLPISLLLLVIFAVALVDISSIAAAATDNKLETSPSTCIKRCGDVEISYPFGIGKEGCFLPGFEVTCNQNNIPFLAASKLQLVEINLLEGYVRVVAKPFLAHYCFQSTDLHAITHHRKLPQKPFTFSSESNRFIVVGCNVGAAISGSTDMIEFSGCNSNCPSSTEPTDNGSCTGNGCCEVPVPRTLYDSLYIVTYVKKTIDDYNIFPNITWCCHGFVAEEGSYKFSKSDINYWSTDLTTKLTARLDWAIGEGQYCTDAKNELICGDNSYCDNSTRQSGYLCKCKAGYQGNPYIGGTSQGCRSNCDNVSPCVAKATCHYDGRYTCVCELGSTGDGFKNGSGCHSQFPLVPVFTVVVVLTLFSLCIFSLSHWVQMKRDKANIRAKHFRHNGGLLLQQHAFNKYPTTKHVKIFSAKELEKATNNYDGQRVLGFGGQGTVYKGFLPDGTQVAIKKSTSQLVAYSQVKQFINELLILAQINHRNIVKLIGCCLETQVPLLVYEFISAGNLYNKIHTADYLKIINSPPQLPWKERLRIAIEIAEALSYLHSYASMPIFHRDVKSSNILLDENGIAKLADFGVSRLVPLDKARVSTVVQGTIGYLDPEYFNTGQLSEKSDVYSYGVVLLELLTGRKPIRHEDTRDYSSLVMHFQSYIGRDNLFEILDESLLEVKNMEELKVVARIAFRCLNVLGIERPTMKTVVQELNCIHMMK